MTPPPGVETLTRRRELILAGLLGLTIVLWVVPIGSSLWLDETGTYFVIKDRLSDAFDRSATFQGQSPFYYLVAWLSLRISRSEVLLRLPSVLAMVGATWFIYRLGCRLLDREAALTSTIVFGASGGVAFAAVDARPYALALLLSTGSTLALVRWVQDGRFSSGYAYVALAALTVYAHYLFALIVFPHIAYLVASKIRKVGPPPRELVTLAVIGPLLTAPLIPQFFSIWRRGGTLSYTGEPSPIPLVLPVVVFAVAAVLGRFGSRSEERRHEISLLLSWSLLPPLVVYAISFLTPLKFFQPKYYLVAFPGLSLLVGWALRRVSAAHLRVAAAAAFVVAALVTVRTSHGFEEWRSALHHANRIIDSDDTPVLVLSGFIEGRQLDWLTDSERADFLLAPIAYYSVRGVSSPLPYPRLPVDEPSRRYVEDLTDRVSPAAGQIVLVTNYLDPFSGIMAGRLAPQGFRLGFVRRFGLVQLVVFERSDRGDRP